jgi:histidinol phosphatase-like enzyme (inositol monophosphatase family)
MTLTPADIGEYIGFLNELADAAALHTVPGFRSTIPVYHKPGDQKFDPVTEADRDAEAAIRNLISIKYPSHSIFGEEHGKKAGASSLSWHIDPIDGTRSYISGVPLWGTLIALHDGAKPVLGLMDQPYLGERYLGQPGETTIRSRSGIHKLKSSSVTQLKDARLGTTDPSLFTHKAEADAFASVSSEAKLTRFGGDCYFYCLLAAGTFDLVIESGLKPHDIQALIPIIENAGGTVTSWSGGDAQNGGQIIAAANLALHAETLKLLKPAASA